VQLVDGKGAASGAPITQGTGADNPDVSCVSFVPGRDEFTVGYLRSRPPSDRNPSWTLLELHESGTTEAPLGVPLGTMDPTCPLTTPSGTGYEIAWQNTLGSFIGGYDRGSNSFDSALFVGAVAFGTPDMQPPLAGLGPAGSKDSAVVFARIGASEAWRVDHGGNLTEQALVFPSQAGQLGQVSAVPVSGALYATYSDYDDASRTVGQRFFVKVSCF